MYYLHIYNTKADVLDTIVIWGPENKGNLVPRYHPFDFCAPVITICRKHIMNERRT